MTILDFDELHRLVDASLKTESEDEFIQTVRNLLQSAYERAVLDIDEEFEFLFVGYPEMLEKALEKPTQGITWEERIRSWYKGENPNGGNTLPSESHNSKNAERGESSNDSPETAAIQRVVETEYHRMFNAGVYDSATAMQEATGKTVYKRWDTALDDRVRETHIYLEGDKKPLDEAFFTFDGDSAMYPGGFTLPQNNCGCRCQLEIETE